MIRSYSPGKRTPLTLLAMVGIGLTTIAQAGPSLAAQDESWAASIVSGTCQAVGAEVAALNPATVPDAPTVGSDDALPGANSFSTVSVGIDALLAEDHAIAVTGVDGNSVTCGDIGGRLTSSGSLIVGLQHDDASDLGGVAVFSPDAAGQTNVSLFVVGPSLGNGAPESAARTTPVDADSADDTSVKVDTGSASLTQESEPTATARPTQVPLPTPTPVPIGLAQENPAPIGTTLEQQELAVTVTSAYFDYGFANAIPRGGYKVLIISATFQNNSDRDLGYEASRFSAIDANNGNTYDPVTIDNVGVLLTGGNLQPGEYVSGTALVEVQETASNVIIKYDVDIRGDDDMYWQ